jgi:hypothetical protein
VNIASPFFVIPVIVLVFTVGIFFATGTKEDGDSTD